ncbi:MAG: hypothetical protein JSV79_13970 [Armatimonadota bacterium]|nr:MAG: hypothetical protein JSV79_13970 [Armatimonadota bacterium]
MRRLSRSERRLLFVLAAVAVLAGVGFYFAPERPPNPEEVQAYYIEIFARAEEMTIRTTDAADEAITLTRADKAGMFSRLRMFAAHGQVAGAPSPYPPKYILQLSLDNGTRLTDIAVGYHLDAPDQPYRGKLWLFPMSPAWDRTEPVPAMVQALDDFIASLRPETSDKEQGEQDPA